MKASGAIAGRLPSAAVRVWSSFPETVLSHTLSAVARPICPVPAHALVSCPCHLVTPSLFHPLSLVAHVSSFSRPNVLPQFLSGLQAHPTLSSPLQGIIHRFFLPWAPANLSLSSSLPLSLPLSLCPSLDGFEVLLWNVWVGKSLFCAEKMITYHFIVLVLSLSRCICSQWCYLVSLERFFFYSVSRSEWGHVGLPCSLSPSSTGFLLFGRGVSPWHAMRKWQRTLCECLSTSSACRSIRTLTAAGVRLRKYENFQT